MKKGPVIRKKEITTEFLISTLQTKLKIPIQRLNDVDASNRVISEREIHRPGLALAGFTDLFTFHRVQVIGNTESRYLKQLSATDRKKSLENLIKYNIPCLIITESNEIDHFLVEMMTQKNIPVYLTEHNSSKFIYLVTDFLDDQFSPQQTVHGVFIDVYGIGILITGRSGIGKSEVGLDLIERGHRLVADDVVLITKKGEDILMGASNRIVEHFLELRGVGIVDIRSIFGIRAIRFQKRVEVVVELADWDPDKEYTRTGLDDEFVDILDVQIPMVKLPIFPGKNITVIVETIALNYLQKHYGYDSAKAFSERISVEIEKKRIKSEKNDQYDRSTQYFEHDFE